MRLHGRSVSKRLIRNKAQAFKGSKRALVKAAAAETDAAPAPEQRQQRAPRQQKVITVDIGNIRPGDEFEGTVVSAPVPSVESHGQVPCLTPAH